MYPAAPLNSDGMCWTVPCECRPRGDPQDNTAAETLTRDDVLTVNKGWLEDGSSAATRNR